MSTIRRVITNGGSFDSKLGFPRPWDNRSVLTLIVKIYLKQCNPTGAAATGTLVDEGSNYSIVKWGAQEWTKFKQGVKEKANQVWDGELFLKPPATFNKADFITVGKTASKNPPYIECDLDIEVTGQSAGSHAELECYRLADAERKTFRSYIEPKSGRDGGILVNRDVEYEVYYDGWMKIRLFNTVAHEIGHVLGLDHPLGPGNEAAKYGTPGSPEYEEVMGFGTRVTVRQATPWIERMKLHTSHTQVWTPTTVRPLARTAGFYLPMMP